MTPKRGGFGNLHYDPDAHRRQIQKAVERRRSAKEAPVTLPKVGSKQSAKEHN